MSSLNETMEVCERGEVYAGEFPGCVYDHTMLVLVNKKGDNFYAKTEKRGLLSGPVDLDGLDILPISPDIWPHSPPSMTPAPEPLPTNCYVKRPSLLGYGLWDSSQEISNRVLDEVTVCEILRCNPHPNIAHYLGCLEVDGKIKGICFVKYPMTLADRAKTEKSLDTDMCLKGIRNGILHLHALGLVHNDINPSNIMMDEDDTPIIIDFDSIKREGELLAKAGTPEWAKEDMKYSLPENDFFGLSKLEEFLLQLDSGG